MTDSFFAKTGRSVPFRLRRSIPLILTLISCSAASADDSLDEIAGMNLEDLMKVEVSTVSRKQQKMADVASAVHVISQEDIRRSGATSIPEALRLAPGLNVARIGSSSWAISARGFNDRYANKLLVQIDGRSVYTPLFSGVFWDVQDTMMEDIDRIEVIRGPGAAMWGANAVNGVINIITKSAKDTQGNLLVAGAGEEERGFAGFRHGGQSDEDTFYRVYGKGFDRNAAVDSSGKRLDDDWRGTQAGFRLDKRLADGDKLTLQGDQYRRTVGETVRPCTILTPPYGAAYPADDKASGLNLLARWQHKLADQSEIQLQGYFDRVQISAPKLSDVQHTFDLDFQHHLAPSLRHDIIWGANLRHIKSSPVNTPEIAFNPNTISYTNSSIFAQDDIAIVAERLRLTVGGKLEKPRFGGTQFLPNARLMWTPDGTNSVWFSASRASRTPSRGEATGQVALGVVPPLTGTNTTPLPMQLMAYSNSNLRGEILKAFEIGYRAMLTPRLSFDIAAYENRYERLSQWQLGSPSLSFDPVMNLNVPLSYLNATTSMKTRGIEAVADWRPLNWMRFEGSYTLIRYITAPWDGVNVDFSGTTPRHQYALRWQTDISARTQFDLSVRHITKLSASDREVPAYTSLDLRLGHAVSKNLDVSIVGQNMLDKRHLEFAEWGNVPAYYMPRSLFAKATWKF